MNTVLFIVGAPGCGKTTLARRLLDAHTYLVPKPKWTVGERVCAAGHYSGATFDGADTVPYNGAREALEFWGANLRDRALTLFDGDRFSNAGCLQLLRALGAERLAVVLLVAGPEVLEARRRERGSNQNPAWMRGRETKATRFSLMGGWDVRGEVSTADQPELVERNVRALLS